MMHLSDTPGTKRSHSATVAFNLWCLPLLALLLTPGPVLARNGPARKAPAARPASSRFVELRVTPAAVVLENGRDARRVLVAGRRADGTWVDVTASAKMRPAGASVRVDAEGFVEPVKPGADRLVIEADHRQVAVPVTVRSVTLPPVSFVRDVMPILSRAGCNAGTCHGSAKGKNGFKLSLRGYDPDYDYHSLVSDLSGRRFNRAAPEQSLMLLKPTEGVPHMGGMVIEPDSPEYRVLRQWIAEGVPSDTARTRRPDRLEVLPGSAHLDRPAMSQTLAVIAHYPDGASRDVTRHAIFTSTVPDVATVSPDGRITAVRRGEAALLVRYEGLYATKPLIVMGNRTGYRWVQAPEYNYIDTLVDKKLRQIKALPSGLCTDEEFIRRVSLDLTGLPPTPEQVRAFLADPSDTKTKREALIDRFLASPEYVDQWTNKWADLLQCSRKYLGDKGVWKFREWIRHAVASNRRYDEFVRELLTARGSSYQIPAASYFRASRDPSAATENVTQLFMGVRFACAKCHDHPFERWTQNQYYQLGAFFARVGVKKGDLDGDEVVYDRPDGDVTHPKTGQVVAPVFPVSATAASSAATRRQALAAWLTSPQNPFFARSMANRLWSYFLGRGVIDPVDDLRNSNPPSNPELLEALTNDFINSGFDLKHMMRAIVQSRVYQQSIATNPWNYDDRINFSHALPRRLTAEELVDSISRATGSPQKFPGVPVGFRAAQLPDSKIAAGGFLDLFGRPARETPCECERSSEMSLSQALNLINGATIADAIVDPEGRLARREKEDIPTRPMIEEIYLAALCRRPRPDEVVKAIRYLTSARTRLEGAQDLMWALINSPAFLFNR